MGIEPTPSAWKAEVLPLNYTRQMTQILRTFAATAAGQTGGGGRIRTFEGISRQIYSLLPLAAWVPLRRKSRIYSGCSGALSMRSAESPTGAGATAAREGRRRETDGVLSGVRAAAAPAAAVEAGRSGEV